LRTIVAERRRHARLRESTIDRAELRRPVLSDEFDDNTDGLEAAA
jgi:hypothetical protein